MFSFRGRRGRAAPHVYYIVAYPRGKVYGKRIFFPFFSEAAATERKGRISRVGDVIFDGARQDILIYKHNTVSAASVLTFVQISVSNIGAHFNRSQKDGEG